jgi:hypothetical protein
VSFNVQGTVYTDFGVTTMGSGRTVKASVNGAAPSASTTTNASGQFTLVVTAASGSVLTIFLSGNTENGVTIVKNLTLATNITGLSIYQDALLFQIATGTLNTVGGANVNTADNSGDSDIAAIYSSSSDSAFTLVANKHLYIKGASAWGGGSSGATATLQGGNVVATSSATMPALTFTSGGTFTPGTGVMGQLTVNCPGGTVTLGADLSVNTSAGVALQAGTLDVSAS